MEAHLDSALGQVAWRFKADGFESEGIVGADVALFLDEEQLVIGLVGRQVANAAAIQGEASEGVPFGVVARKRIARPESPAR